MTGIFNEIDVESIKDNVFKLLDKDWMLVTAGNTASFNTMTASWGAFGILWHKPIAICFIRPQRFTHQFIESNEYYTLSFFEEKHRDILNFCGKYSGRKIDKVKETRLEVLVTKTGNITFSQARMVMECKKIYADKIKPGQFTIPEMATSIYPGKDYHGIYVGEIVNCLVKT